jgi:hypothetical protein
MFHAKAQRRKEEEKSSHNETMAQCEHAPGAQRQSGDGMRLRREADQLIVPLFHRVNHFASWRLGVKPLERTL